VIVGRDADLWLTASAIGVALGPAGIKISAVELPSRLGTQSVFATLPPLETLHSKLGIDEATLLGATGGSFSLGWNLVPQGRRQFLIAHGSYGAPIDGGDFFSFWAKARRFGLEAQFEDFSPTAMAARHGRVLLPDERTEAFGRTDYAYHLPALPYASMLKARAARLGVAMHQASEVGVSLDSQTGDIAAVQPDSGPALGGDLFIDASGEAGILIGALGVTVEDWTGFFPFDRRLTAQAKRFSSVPTYGELRLSHSCWTALEGSQRATHLVHAFADVGEKEDAALARASAASGLELGDASIAVSAPSLRKHLWARNCVAIGRSACAFDPLFELDLHSVQLGIVHLLSLFPVASDAAAEASEYDRIVRSHFERLRDFQSALYLLAGLSTKAPASLEHKIATFRARGAIAPMEDESFSADQWRALFVGLGAMPETWPPAIDRTAPDQVKQGFRKILSFVHDRVLEQAPHDRYLADIGGALR
jgi:tryptophan halogenase